MEISDKKIIAEWMGWECGDMAGEFTPVIDNTFVIDFDPSSLDCPHKVWQAIWANMNHAEYNNYLDKLEISYEKVAYTEFVTERQWYHVVSNEIKTKALLQMIKEGL